MAKQIYVNLPVKNLEKTKAFFSKLGFEYNLQFTNEKGACMIVDDNIFVMLLQEEFFKTFTKKEIADATKTTEVLIAISAESREKVDETVNKAIEAGGSTYSDPQDHGWMYLRTFADLDGHQWEIMYADEKALQEQMANAGAAQNN